MRSFVAHNLNNHEVLFHVFVEKYIFEFKTVLMKIARPYRNKKQICLSTLKGTDGKSGSPECVIIVKTNEIDNGRSQLKAWLNLLLNC
jgi:hypothetical protein